MIEWPEAHGEKKSFYLSGYFQENLDNYIKGVMRKNTSAVFIIDGRSGLGKSTLACQLGCYINLQNRKYMKKETRTPKFSLDNLCWTPEKLIELLKNAQKGDVIILDESMILSNRSAMSEMNKAVVIMMSMIRSKQIFVIFCANSLFDLERNLPLHRADLLVHLYAVDDKFASRGRYFVVPSAKGRLKYLFINGKKFYDYSRAWPAFRDHFSKWFPFDDKEYEKMKQKAIVSYFDKPTSKLAQKQEHQRNLLMFHMVKNGTPKQEILDLIKISDSQLNLVLQKMRDE